MIRTAQLLLITSGAILWAASRLAWVSIRSFDGLGQPRSTTLSGASWSTALVPMAVVLLAAALAALAVRGWLLRAVAALIAVVCLALGYLGISLLTMRDVGPRGAALAGVAVADLVASERHLAPAVLTLIAAVISLIAAVFLMRAAGAPATDRYAPTPPTRADADDSLSGGGSARGMWDALDAGRDPTDADTGAIPEAPHSDTEGR